MRPHERPTDVAVGLGKRPQSAGQRGRHRTRSRKPKPPQTSQTQEYRHTTENRGVPGSSPGLAIQRPCEAGRLAVAGAMPIPIFLFSVLFGLSMDYQVFGLSRNYER